MGIDQNLDATKAKIDPAIWLRMRASALRKGQKIHEWIQDAIETKLQIEEKNEK